MRLKDGRELVLRPAEKEEAGEILAYLNQVGGESDNLLFGENGFQGMPIEAEERFIEEIASAAACVMLIGRIDGEIACVGSLSASARERIAHNGELAISVKRKFWGLGVGTHLLEGLIGFARQCGSIRILHLGVKAENRRAIELYRKLGFQEIGRYPQFFKIRGEYYDEILMNLYL